MKHTIPALIEDLQAFQEKISEADFLVDLVASATREQRAALVRWVYTEYAPPDLSLNPDTQEIEVTPYIEAEYTGTEAAVYAVPLQTLLHEANGSYVPKGTGYEFLSVIPQDVWEAANMVSAVWKVPGSDNHMALTVEISLAIMAEREACAKMAQTADEYLSHDDRLEGLSNSGLDALVERDARIADAIRNDYR